MTGPTSLKSQKALLTRYCNKLERIIQENEEAFKTENNLIFDPNTSQRLQALVLQLHSTSRLVQETLCTFTASVDSLIESLNDEQEAQAQEHIEKAHTILEQAQLAAIEIEARRLSARDHAQLSMATGSSTQPTGNQVTVARPQLPAIPIPPFTGKIWEFANFWTLFCENVHDQPLTNLQKFNYLLNALQGEARESIRRYPVTEENYEHAITFLKTKYGNESKIIANLQSRLEQARAENNRISAQRRLLEFVMPIITQLEEKGVNLNGSYLSQKLISKFSPELQRQVLKHRLKSETQESNWTMQTILADLDELIATEERIEEAMKAHTHTGTGRIGGDPGKPRMDNRKKGSEHCMFCGGGNHRSSECRKYASIEERRAVFRDSSRCLNCAAPGHWAKDCTRDGCRGCKGKKHHHTLCPMREPRTANSYPQTVARTKEHTPPPEKTQKGNGPRTDKQKKVKQAQHSVKTCVTRDTRYDTSADDQEDISGTIAFNTHGHVKDDKHFQQSESGNVLLLTGVAPVYNYSHDQWEDVEILLDTGADQSFITDDLAQQLGLECTAQVNFVMYTFGAEKPRRAMSGVTSVQLMDQHGEKHDLRLYTTPVLTMKGKTAHLEISDWAFIGQRNIRLSSTETGKRIKPQILLGCDQLWNLLDVPNPRFTLPSGLQLIPSRIGYLITGKQKGITEQSHPYSAEDSPTAAAINTLVNFEEEMERWDKYWTMDNAGICEFTGTKNAEKEAVNQKVSKFFEDSIEKREDGYYIRFPYKDNYTELPSNKAIALKRLHSVIQSLRKTPTLLHEYDETFQSQRDSGIIEEAPQALPEKGSLLHYIPHQPVLTPHKETTKLRIVFDASAHFKNNPSLNDVLHQGPLILPELYAMLLRFRTPKYVAIADVEKAFLQVRLHEKDRDATRFLWVRNINQPISEDNIITFRFTRVTFGLNVSPYLLGGTIHHHLRTTVDDTTLADEIRNNLYVDNLILAASTEEELVQKSLTARQIFQDMGMNLREFLSNGDALRDKLPKEAHAMKTTQKVLGITWDAKRDCINIRCNFDSLKNITKRVIARQIAMIYDPFGWLVPLLTQAKKFQQDLWKEKFSWDEKLPSKLAEQWSTLVENVNNFQISIPRRLRSISDTPNLAIFADASEIAIAASAYIFNENYSELAMAKCKLPSIKTKTTMPKLEMNALTLAMRLANSITQALKERIAGYPWTIHVFSDSQIALSWLTSPTTASLGVLVANRVREVRRIVTQLNNDSITVIFRYVNTSQNPADAGTRGLSREQMHDRYWWEGPEFLKKPIDEWKHPVYQLWEDVIGDDSCAFTNVNFTCGQEDDTPNALIDLCRYSSFSMAKRVTTWILRFIKKTMRRLKEDTKDRIVAHIPEIKEVSDVPCNINGSEVRAGRYALIRNHQLLFLTKEYRKNMENSLRPYLDKWNIWRSKGRMGNSALNSDTKDPILIMPNTALAQLIIQEAHGLYHKGIEHTIATVRERYWIPKLRQQVRKHVSHCIKCRRFNALPYQYPDSTDLPERRVLKSNPFQHTGLDFFDLPQCEENERRIKLYGCIFTCTVTRLIHLEIVRSLAIEEFLNALRRFIARRGIPKTITCDNAPTFLLAAKIIEEQGSGLTEHAAQIVSNQEIEWRHITPYAPWQGGFYERLIKSIKQAIYKALRNSETHSFDDIHTFLIEVEACLNSRPLTYQSAVQEEFTSLRPIDFLQRDLNLSITLGNTESETQDPDYLPSDSLHGIQTRQQALEALNSSRRRIERFWTIWQQQYLISLRESHKKNPTNQRHGGITPSLGDVVLVSDPVLPRNDWKMARITGLRQGTDGAIREAELITATRRKIRRPVNLLIPLELQDSEQEVSISEQKEAPPEQPAPQQPPRTHNYNLRERKATRHVHNATTAISTRTTRGVWFLFYIMILNLLSIAHGNSTEGMHVSCGDKGVMVHAQQGQTFEICAERLCEVRHMDTAPLLIKFPLDITIRDYRVLVKWNVENHLATMETRCKGMDFCSNIDCNICLSILLNPECWPLGAILTFTLCLYGIIALTYACLYVPVTIGKPIRIADGIILKLTVILAKTLYCCIRVLRRRRTRGRNGTRMTSALATALALLYLVQTTRSCQHVNVLEQSLTTCTQENGKEICKTSLLEVLKINSFRQQACLRLVRNSTLVLNIKIRWKGLYLHCDQETLYFTRSIHLNVTDSKRCPRMGSCKGEKCAGINSSSIIPELKRGNHFPGRTGCIESCGGFGCDCFYPSSGCLFYRIFATPADNKIYDIFRCMRWREKTMFETTIEDISAKFGKESYVVQLLPDMPITLPSLQITMTSLSLPPTPALSSTFFTNGQDTAIWTGAVSPNLLCESREKAERMKCILADDCNCAPAEFKISCQCTTPDITKEFDQLQLKIPKKTPFWELRYQQNTSLVAKIPHMVSSEIIVEFHQTWDTTVIEQGDGDCLVEDSLLQGCYHCAGGATSKIRCVSSKELFGEVLCASHTFVIPCAPHGPESELRLHLDSARQLIHCTISCGQTKNEFALRGTLKYVNTFHYPDLTSLKSNSTIFNEFEWPDFGHIMDIFLTWYKTFIIVLIAAALVLGLIYLYGSTLGIGVLKIVFRLLWIITCIPPRAVRMMVCALIKLCRSKQTKYKKNT